MTSSDHCPCIVNTSSHIPKGGIFRFENYRLKHDNFGNILSQVWDAPTTQSDCAKNFTAKFKNLRKALKDWQRNLSMLRSKRSSRVRSSGFFFFL